LKSTVYVMSAFRKSGGAEVAGGERTSTIPCSRRHSHTGPSGPSIARPAWLTYRACVTPDHERRQTIEQHWAASEAGDVVLEHRLYAEDAVLDYPQSGERFVGRSTIAEQRTGNPARRSFELQRVLGAGSTWVSECVITYDGVPTISVSIMEFSGDLVAHETQYFADPFEAPAARASLAQRIDPRN
jgi:hypothetical protein